MYDLTFAVMDDGAATPLTLSIEQAVIAGWTGRDEGALEMHIKELEALGVARPKTTPIFYRVAASLLTQDDEIQVSGPHSSGEVECVYVSLADGLWVGLGADHTDRKAETINVSLSKQMCAKPIGATLWRHDEVMPHWDRLVLRSFALVGGKRERYQEGTLAAMRPPSDLVVRYGGLKPGSAMFGGTLPVHGGIRPAEAFEMELEDPVLGRKMSHAYRIVPLPVEG